MPARKKTAVSALPNRSPRKIAAAVALAMLAGGTGAVWAAGLGRLTVQSALGQPLRAEVEVTSLNRDEAATLSARLASVDAFRQAGLEYNSALGSLRFGIERRDGRTFVRITSSQPINEPFVDLLVELNWANGKFVREYTFLLDPPELRTANRETVEGGASQSGQVAAPSTGRSEPAAAAPRTETTAPRADAERPAAPQRPARAARAPEAAAPAAGDRIDVKPGDTLAGIAARVRPEGLALDQVLVSLYETNPNAFYGSIHQLKAGASLAVPGREAMAAVDAAKAREQIRVQTENFNAYRSRLADAARAMPAARSGQTAEGSIGARVDDKGAPAGGRDQLRLSKSEPGTPAGAGSATGSATSKTATAEQGVARDAAMREAQSRVSELEKNVTDLQKLLELKNRQLADLQKQVEDAKVAGKSAAGSIAQAPAAAAPAAAPVATPPAAASVEPPKAEAPKAEAPRVEPSGAEAPKAPVASAPQGDAAAGGATGTDGEAPKAEGEAPKAETPPAAAPAAPKPAVVAKQPAPEPGLLDDLLDNPLLLPGIGAIIALGAGYGWYSMRRRRKVEKFEDSLIAGEGIAANSLFGSTGGQTVDTNNSVFNASTKDSGVDVHATEVDPIAEAEVYIAYGREAQAEEILKEALKKQPERQAIRTKLLEIYSGRKDAAAFNAMAADMYEMTGGQNEEWPKVVTLGLGLDPSNPLYTGEPRAAEAAKDSPRADASVAPLAGIAGAAAAASVEMPELPSFELSKVAPELPTFELPKAAPEIPSFELPKEAPVAAKSADPAVDFGLLETPVGRFAETQPLTDEPVARKGAIEPEVPALDFDLDLDTTIGKAGGMLGAGRDEPASRSELERAVEGRFELPSLDLGTDNAAFETEEQAVTGLDSLNIDLPSLESLSQTAVRSVPRAEFAAQEQSLDLDAIGLDLEPAPAGAAGDGQRWQEMATKLDLASAYEEIGDKEGARELLEEVLKGGDGDQQTKARAMLARIG